MPDTVFDQVITGTDRSETLKGGSWHDHIIGLGGGDGLYGDYGDDWLDGGSGDDKLVGGPGADTLEGGAGNDTYVLGSETGDIIVDTGGIDLVTSTISRNLGDYVGIDDLEIYASFRRVTVATGTEADNQLSVSSMISLIDGGAGDDVLSGSAYGGDIFVGGGGHDVLDGSYTDLGPPPWWGEDSRWDRFDFRDPADSEPGAERDVIQNFLQADSFGDMVNLGGMDADATIRGNQAFNFIADGDFSGTAGELKLTHVEATDDATGYSLISGDVNGDGLVDFEIEVHTRDVSRYLTVNDIIL